MFTFLRFLSSHITKFRLNISPKSNIFLTGIALVRGRNFTNLSRATMLQSPKIASQSRCMASVIIVKHDHKKFFIEVDGLIAFLKYDNNNGVMHITHTRVPTKLNGHGIGKILSKAALEYAIQHDLLIRISCPFVQHYVNKYEPKFHKYIL
ncbi:protein NATD1 [Drosophila hydei]|uniref:Protein NATD1 n=1 Tax=Drosophila hydei TaxID=7224 RepID=A0A6J1LRN9_DROHY|nr:protein NATD1 [Drosophila hydei]